MASFKGDKETHLDKLIHASQKKMVDDIQLSERQLIPYFDEAMAEIDEARCQPLQLQQRRKSQHQMKAATPQTGKVHSTPVDNAQRKRGDRTDKKHQEGLNSKVKAENTNNNVSPNSTRKAKGKKATNGDSLHPQQKAGLRKHHRDPSQKQLHTFSADGPSAVVQSNLSHATPPRVKRHVVNEANEANESSGSAALGTARFAGPAFVNSPTPESLPIPTGSLLALHETVDKIQAGLVL